MTNEEAARACNEIYNVFWLKWRDVPLNRNSPEWDQIHVEAEMLFKAYPSPLGIHMLRDLLDELENRVRVKENG